MPTLNIEGRSVQVDDSFLKLSPDQQNATVDEIAKSFAPKPSITDAVTDIPSEIGKAASEAVGNVTALKDQANARAQQGPIEGIVNTGKAAAKAVLAVPELIASPFTGTARSVGGHLLSEGERLVGENVVNPVVEYFGGKAQHPDQRQMYETAKGDVDTALSALESRGAPVSAPVVAPAGPGQAVVTAADRLSNVAGPVRVPQAIASDNMAVQRVGQAIRNIPVVGDAIPRATEGLVNDLGEATRSVADQYGSGSGPNVANRIGNTLSQAAEAETRTAQNAAARSDAAVLADHENAVRAVNESLDTADANALERARQAVGDMSPQDMGQALIQRLRTGEQAAEANKNALYERAGNMDASIHAGEVRNVRSTVAQGLDDAGTVVDKDLTPAASKMMDELQRLSDLQIPNKAVGARLPATGTEQPAAVSVQGIEQARKRLNFFRSAASNDADRRAATQIMHQFDDWQSNAFENALFSGGDEALDAFRQARAANASWRQRFFNNEDDAGKFVQRIVTGEVTPQEAANYIVGAGKVGAKGVSSRLLTRIAEATNNDPEAMQAIRGGVWNRLSQATEGTNAKPAAKVASDIGEFLNGSGRDVAQRLFTPEQQGIMRAYADTLRQNAAARQNLAETAANTKPSSMDVGIGPMQKLATDVLGRGGKTDEALFSAIDSYAKSGGRGDIQTLARLVHALPQQDRGDLAGSIIRNLGVSPRTGQFSPDVFASQWKSYTPQAKTVLFGNAGAQRVALDDIMTISERLKQIGQRFGNPSGTAQNVGAAGLGTSAASAFAHAVYGNFVPALSLITGVTGGAVTAKLLSSAAGASSASKWARAYAALSMRPTAHTIAAYQVASRNLANTAKGFGSNATAMDFMRALQPSSTRSDQDRLRGE
jgi:hypothetical protein